MNYTYLLRWQLCQAISEVDDILRRCESRKSATAKFEDVGRSMNVRAHSARALVNCKKAYLSHGVPNINNASCS